MKKTNILFLAAGLLAAGAVALGANAILNDSPTFAGAGDKPSHSITYTAANLIEDMYEVDDNYGTAFLTHDVTTCTEQLELELEFWAATSASINEGSLFSLEDVYGSAYIVLDFKLFYGASFSCLTLVAKEDTTIVYDGYDPCAYINFYDDSPDITITPDDEKEENDIYLYTYGFSMATIGSIVITYTC